MQGKIDAKSRANSESDGIQRFRSSRRTSTRSRAAHSVTICAKAATAFLFLSGCPRSFQQAQRIGYHDQRRACVTEDCEPKARVARES